MTRLAHRCAATGPDDARTARREPNLAALTALLLVAALSAAGCDNPACVFSRTQCQPGSGGGGPGGIGTFSAIFPNDVSWITPSAPIVKRSAPSIINALPETPLIVEFDQSLDPASLSGAFELLDSITLMPVPLLDPPALVGDGRVVVLTVPAVGQTSPLVPGNTYLLRFTDDQEIRDVTGQAFDFGTGQDIFEMGVSDMPPANPRVVYSYPADDSILASDLTEIVVVFDRNMDPGTFDNMSFLVTVNDAQTPLNPMPSSLVLTGFQMPTPALQVWRWSHAQGNAPRESLGADARMRVRLSPTGAPLMAAPPPGGGTGGTLPQTDIEFRTALVRAPTSVLKAPNALPLDAIGEPNLESGGGVLQVTLADPAGSNDTLDVFIIGGSPANAQLLKAEQRSVPITALATSVVLGEAELDLREPNGVARFRDGEIEFMARVRRATASTVARRADADGSAAGFQRLVLDLTPPRLLGLGVDAGSVSLVRSELGGVVIVGLGDEEIRFARVTTALGDNFETGATDPPVVAFSSERGRFIAAPVIGAPDVLDQSSTLYEVEVFDRALNPATNLPVASGVYEQMGSVGPGTTPVGGLVTVRVFDADTAAPLDGALVMSHQDDGTTLTDLDSETTTNGSAQVLSAATGATVVTVQHTGYDSFTFHGVPVERFDVPLPRAGVAPASISGVARRTFNSAVLTNVNWVGDSRALQPGSPLLLASNWTVNAMGQLESRYGPFPVRAQRLGLTAHFATNPAVGAGGAAFLTSSALRFSDEPLAYGMNAMGQDLDVNVGAVGDDIAPYVFDIDNVAGFALQGGPIITVEGVAPGLEGAPTLGISNPTSQSPTQWIVAGATASTVTGSLVTMGAIEGDLHHRAEVRDMAGNRIGARPRFSMSGPLLQPIDIPHFLVPGSGGTTGGEAYSIEVADVLPDTLGMDGLYRVVITDSGGRRWHLWALDPAGNQPGMGQVRLAVPPVAAMGGSPLADGTQMARVSAWGLRLAWMGTPLFDRTRFLWADVERRHEVFAHTVESQFTQD